MTGTSPLWVDDAFARKKAKINERFLDEKEFKNLKNIGKIEAVTKTGLAMVKDKYDLVIVDLASRNATQTRMSNGLELLTPQFVNSDGSILIATNFHKKLRIINASQRDTPHISTEIVLSDNAESAAIGKDKERLFVGMLNKLVTIDLKRTGATAGGLISAQQKALEIYNSKKPFRKLSRAREAVATLESAGIAQALKIKIQGIESNELAGILDNYGLLLENSYRTEDALAVYRRVLELDPARTITWLKLGDVLRSQLQTSDDFDEKILQTHEIKSAYLEYLALGGKATPKISEFLVLNILDKPITDPCEYIATYSSKKRLLEIIGSGQSILQPDKSKRMRVNIRKKGRDLIPTP